MALPPCMFAQSIYEDNHYTDPCTEEFYEYEKDASLWLEAHNQRSFMGHDKDASCNRHESNWLFSQMSENIPENITEDRLEKLLHIPELADEAFSERGQDHEISRNFSLNEKPSMFDIDELLQWKRCQDKKHERFMLEQQMMQVKEHEIVFRNRMIKKPVKQNNGVSKTWVKPVQKEPTEKVQKKNRYNRITKPREGKRPDCWHYVQGHCKRGKYCNFTHDSKHSFPDTHKIFLGGLPFKITETSLCQHLKEMGYNVINKPKILGGFSPQVCFASESEAKRLIELGSIMIDGAKVDVRRYQAFTKKSRDKHLSKRRRSVFLGGLRKGTTTQMIKKGLEAMRMKVVNYPLIKSGCCPQVTMATEKQAQNLVSMGKVEINGGFVHVRPSFGAAGPT